MDFNVSYVLNKHLYTKDAIPVRQAEVISDSFAGAAALAAKRGRTLIAAEPGTAASSLYRRATQTLNEVSVLVDGFQAAVLAADEKLTVTIAQEAQAALDYANRPQFRVTYCLTKQLHRTFNKNIRAITFDIGAATRSEAFALASAPSITILKVAPLTKKLRAQKIPTTGYMLRTSALAAASGARKGITPVIADVSVDTATTSDTGTTVNLFTGGIGARDDLRSNAAEETLVGNESPLGFSPEQLKYNEDAKPRSQQPPTPSPEELESLQKTVIAEPLDDDFSAVEDAIDWITEAIEEEADIADKAAQKTQRIKRIWFALFVVVAAFIYVEMVIIPGVLFSYIVLKHGVTPGVAQLIPHFIRSFYGF